MQSTDYVKENKSKKAPQMLFVKILNESTRKKMYINVCSFFSCFIYRRQELRGEENGLEVMEARGGGWIGGGGDRSRGEKRQWLVGR